MKNIVESLKILESTTKSLNTSSEHYETQVQATAIPGVDEAVQIIAYNEKVTPAIIYMGIRMGVYLAIRVEENRKLENLLGEIK
jgi:hypothetical protein